MKTTWYPMVQIQPGIWEIDEFDVASMYLIIGEKRAMLIDCGMGIGDLKKAVRQLTDKPLTVVITHGHLDHTGHGREFSDLWINPLEAEEPIPGDYARRISDIKLIALREKGRYPYHLEEDVREPGPEEPMPVLHDLVDGMQFDLGGKIITAYDCPGHAKGQMVFLDETDRILFCGDAVNYNLGLRATSIETAARYLERLADMQDRYDVIYNGHHDFRPLGAPLGADCLPNVIDLCHQLLDGTAKPEMVPSFWGPASGRPDSIMVRKDRNYLGFDPEHIHDKK